MKKSVCLLVIFLFTVAAWSVKVSPIRYDASIARGTTREFTLNLTGTAGLASQSLTIYPSDLSMDRNGALNFDSLKTTAETEKFYGSLANSAVSWIKMETPKLTLLSDQYRPIKFKVTVPSSAIPGEYYAVIMVEPDRFQNMNQANNPVNFKIKTRVAVVFVLDVPGRLYEKKGEVESVGVVNDKGYVRVISSFKNNGNIHLDVAAKVTVRRVADRTSLGDFTMQAVNSSQERSFIFPGAVRDFAGTITRQLPAGDYLAEVSYDYGYSFRTAKKNWPFTVTRSTDLDESKVSFLSVENKEGINLILPSGSMRTQIVKMTNVDYRPLNITINPGKFTGANPDKFSLKPGEVRNVQVIVKAPEYEGNSLSDDLTFQPDRGKIQIVKVVINKPGVKNNPPVTKKKN